MDSPRLLNVVSEAAGQGIRVTWKWSTRDLKPTDNFSWSECRAQEPDVEAFRGLRGDRLGFVRRFMLSAY